MAASPAAGGERAGSLGGAVHPLIGPLRRQPPVHSPLSARALAAGAAAAASPGRAARARRELEELLRREYDAAGVLLTDSGTTALRLALRACCHAGAGAPSAEADAADGPGGAGASGRSSATPIPAALPAYSCYDLVTAAVGAAAPVLLYDVDPETLGPDWESLERALERGAGVVVLAPLYGHPVDAERAADLCREHGAVLVEDAAQAAGATLHGRLLGTCGAWTVLSFGRGKGWTGGKGGALLARDDDTAAALEGLARELPPGGRGWRVLAAAAAQWGLARPSLYGLPASLPFLGLGETRYREPSAPAGLTAAAAGILGVTRGLLEEERRVRARRAERLLEHLDGSGRLRAVRAPAGSGPGHLRLPALRREHPGRRALRVGVGPPYPRPLSHLSPLRALSPDAGADRPGAELLARRLVTLPTHGLLRERDLDLLEVWLAQVPRSGAGGGDPPSQTASG